MIWLKKQVQVVYYRKFFVDGVTGIAKLSCFKEKHLSAVILRNWCSQKVCLQSTTLLKGRLRHKCFSVNLAKS